MAEHNLTARKIYTIQLPGLPDSPDPPIRTSCVTLKAPPGPGRQVLGIDGRPTQMGIIHIIGWILWGIAILLAFSFSLTARSLIAKGGSIESIEFGVALLEGFLYCIVVIIFYFTTLNKLHLIWVIPVIYFGTVFLLLPGIPFISSLLAQITLIVFAPLVLIGISSNSKKQLSRMIFQAVADGDTERVREYLSKDPEIYNARDPKGNTPLGYASEYGHSAVAQLLIKAGADINAKNDAGVAPLHYACLYGNKNIVEMLVANGVDINAPVVKEGTECTALQFAEHGQHYEIVDFLVQHNATRVRMR